MTSEKGRWKEIPEIPVRILLPYQTSGEPLHIALITRTCP